MLHGCHPCEAHITLTCELTAEILGVSSKTAECHFQTFGGILLGEVGDFSLYQWHAAAEPDESE